MEWRKITQTTADGKRKLRFDFEIYGKVIIFLLLIVLGAVLIINNRDNYLWLLPVLAVLIIENAIKMWGTKNYRQKTVCYLLDTVCLSFLTYFSDGTLISTIYVIILSEFYIKQKKLSNSVAMFICDVFLFLSMIALSNALKGEAVDVSKIIVSAFNDMLIFALHFLVFNFTVQVYYKNKEISRAMEELNESNEKLRVAYLELQEVTALQERQRIAKDIHDTAGHSITTVIMQTESAKLLIDSDPEEAKKRIIAANLQAKHALEELRESVHLLSGKGEQNTLRMALLAIIHETTDGTGIAVRSDIDDIALCDAKARFLCNTLKEGISNGLRHGGATAFYFELKKEGNAIRFLLSDNGKGQQLEQFKEGFGLSGMRERAERLGGNIFFETEPDEGFEIHLSIPLDIER